MISNRLFVLLVVFLSTSLQAKVMLEKTGAVRLDRFESGEFNVIRTRRGTKIATFPSEGTITIVDYATGKQELSFEILEPKKGERFDLLDVREAPSGDLLAVVSTIVGTSKSRYYYVNLTKREVSAGVDAGWPVYVHAHVDRGGRLLYLIDSDVPNSGPKLGRDEHRYLVREAESGKLLGDIVAPFKGTGHVREMANGEIRVLIAGYEVVALWVPVTGQVTKLVERSQPSRYPDVLKDNAGTELVIFDRGEKTKATLYRLSDALQGKLVPVRQLALNQQLTGLGDKLAVFDRDGDQRNVADKNIVLRSFETDHVLGRFAVDFMVSHRDFALTMDGKIFALLSGPSKVGTYSNEQRGVLSDAAGNASMKFEAENGYTGRGHSLVAGKNGSLFAQIAEYYYFRREAVLRVVDARTGKTVLETSDEIPLSELVPMPDGRVASVLANTKTGEVCVRDWTDGGAKDCFPAGHFRKSRLQTGDYFLEDLKAGNEFFLTVDAGAEKETDAALTGLRSYKLR